MSAKPNARLWAVALASLPLCLPLQAQVFNLHLVTDNQPDYTDFDSFVDSSTKQWQTPEEKSIAVWRWGVWLQGYPAVPTPAKEYMLKPLPEAVQNQMALGGIIGSVIALVAASVWVYLRPGAISSSMLAGAMTAPGFYTLRFILAGRGHDGTEFQEAQAALGLSYAGHAADWLFVSLFVVVAVFWFWRTRARPTPKLVARLVIGAIAALVVLGLLQSINNRVFDPLLEPKPSQPQPGGEWPRGKSTAEWRRARALVQVASAEPRHSDFLAKSGTLATRSSNKSSVRSMNAGWPFR